MAAKKAKTTGGIKGFLERASSSFAKGGLMAQKYSWILAKKAGSVGFIVATTSIVVMLPLIFEISRESLGIENERSRVKDLRSQGFSDRQLEGMGFSKAALYTAAVAVTK